MAVEAQVKVTGDFSKIISDFRKLLPMVDVTKGSFAELGKVINRMDFSAIEAGGKRALNAVHKAMFDAAKLARSSSPMAGGDFQQRLLGLDKAFASTEQPEIAHQLKTMLREAQQQAITNALKGTATGINEQLRQLTDSLSVDAAKYKTVDASGKTQFVKVGDDAKKVIEKFNTAVATAAKSSLELIDIKSIEDWGKRTLGKDWTTRGATGVKGVSAQTLVRDSLKKANEQIVKNIQDGITKNVEDAIASGKKLSDTYVKDIDSQISKLRGQIVSAGGSEAYIKSQLAKLGEFSDSIKTKLNEYSTNLVNADEIKKLEQRAKELLDSIQRKGSVAGKGYDLSNLFREATTHADKLSDTFKQLRTTVEQTFRRQAESLFADFTAKGQFDKSAFRALWREARAGGVDKSVRFDVLRKAFETTRQITDTLAAQTQERLNEEIKKKADALNNIKRQIESALKSASTQAAMGAYAPKSLDSLIEQYKKSGGNVFQMMRKVEEINRTALKTRIEAELASNSKLAAGIETRFRLEGAQHGVAMRRYDVADLFKQLAARKQQEIQTAIDVFYEQYAEALFRIKQQFLSGQRVDFEGFQAKWTRRAGEVGAVFDSAAFNKQIQALFNEKASRDLAVAAEGIRKQQAKLLADIDAALRKSSREGTSVANVGELTHRLTAEIMSGQGNWAALTDAAVRLRDRVEQDFIKEIRALKDAALNAQKAISQDKITSLTNRIRASGDLFDAGEINGLLTQLSNAVVEVDTTLRNNTIAALRKSIRDTSANLQLSAKQLRAELGKFTAEAKGLGVSGDRNVVNEIATLHQNTVIRDLRELVKSASIDAQTLAALRQEFGAAGGVSARFTGASIGEVRQQLVATTTELKANGKKFEDGLVTFYESLFRETGASSTTLASLSTFVKSQQTSVNTEYRSRLEAAVRKQLADANRLKQVVSEYTLRTLEQNWLKETGGTDFRSVFSAELGEQERRRTLNALKQRLEGIWKPYLERLRELSSMKSYDPSGYSAKLLSVPKEQMEAEYRKAVRAIIHSGTTGFVDRGEVTAALNSLQAFKTQAFADWDKAFAADVRKRVDAYRTQLSDAILANNKAMLPKVDDLRNLQRQSIGTVAQGDAARMMQDYTKAQRHFLEQSAREFQTRLKQMTAQINRGVRGALSRGELNSVIREGNELERQLRETGSAMTGMFKQIRTNLVRASNEARRQAASMGGSGQGGKGEINGVPAGIYQNYLRQLPMQITDIVVGLSTGQRPMYVLLQQGGQLKDMFGGIGNAVKEVGKYILGLLTPTNLAIAAVGSLVVLFGSLVKRASDIRQEMLQTNVVLSGAAGRTFDYETVRQYGKELSQMYAIMESKGRQAFMSVAQNARVPEQVLKEMFTNIRDVQAYLGKGFDFSGLEDTIKTLSNAFQIDPHGGLMRLREFLFDIKDFNEEEAKQVSTLYKKALATKDYDEKARAMAEIMKIVNEHSKGAAQEGMTQLQKETEKAKLKFIEAWQVLADDSAWDTLYHNIVEAGTWFVDFASKALEKIRQVMIGLRFVHAEVSAGSSGRAAGGLLVSAEGIAQALTAPFTSVADNAGQGLTASEHLARIGERIKDGFVKIADGGEMFWGAWTESQEEAGARIQEAQDRLFDQLQENAKKNEKVVKNLKGGYNWKEEDLPTSPDGKKGGGKSQMEKDADAAEKYILKLKEAWENYRQLTKLEQLSFDLENGKVKMTQQQIAVATELAKAIDERTRKQAEELRIMERKRMEAQKMTEVQNKIQEYALQAARMQRADSVVDYYQQMVEYDNQLAQRIRDLNFARDKEVREYYLGGKSNQIADLNAYYDYQINLERQKAEELKQLWDAYYREQIRLGTSWLTGFEKGLDQVAFKVKDLSSEVASAVESWADQMGDALANFVRTGKFDFRSLADSILNDIARMAANDFIRNLIGGFKYGFGTPIADSGHKEVQDRVAQFKSIDGVQMVHVVNMPSSGDLGSAISGAFGSSAGGFTLSNPTSIIGNPNRPLMDFSSATQIGKEAAQGIVTATTPAIQTAANSCFGGVEDGLGGLLSRITSGIGNIFSGFGGGGGGGIGGFFGSLFSGIGSFISRIFGFSSGGYTGPGGKYTPAGIVHAGEYVINAAATRRLGLDFLNRLNGYANGGYVSPTPPAVNHDYGKDAGSGLEVNIYNNSNNDVRTQRNASGGLDIFIEQAVNAVAGDIAAGGAVASALQSTYALNRGNGLQRSGY